MFDVFDNALYPKESFENQKKLAFCFEI